MRVLVASSSIPSAGTIARILEEEGIRPVSWEVGTPAPKPEEGRWDAVVLDLRNPWPVRARFLPAGPRIALLDPGNENLAETARKRGARRILPELQAKDLAESIRGLAGEAGKETGPMAGMFMQAALSPPPGGLPFSSRPTGRNVP